jgi:hypothetical protein
MNMHSPIVRGLIAGLAAGVVYFLLMVILGGMVGPYLGMLFAGGPMVIAQGIVLGLVYSVIEQGIPARLMPLRGLAYGLVVWLLAWLVPYLGGQASAAAIAASFLNSILDSSILGCLLMGLIVVGVYGQLRRWQ